MINQDFLIQLCGNQQQPWYLTALIGMVGVICGALITVVGNFLIEYFKTSKIRKADKERMSILESMFNHEKYEWRKLSTLASVIGLDEVNTKDLLILIGARASETNGDTWGLISKHPINEIKTD
jgi:hypothetical protein